MALIVQKYGGSSVGSTERIKNVARRVADYRKRGDQVVTYSERALTAKSRIHVVDQLKQAR